MTARFGRIPLDRITAEWEDGHPINPRLLAGEVAALLRKEVPADRPIFETCVSAILSAAPGGCAVMHGALADYFDSASFGKPAATITTTAGPVPASAVLVWRQWINRLADEATSRALYVAGRAIPAGDNYAGAMIANASPAASQAEQPPLPSGSEPGYVAMRQREQRREAESSAAKQLEAKEIALQDALRREAAKDAMLATRDAQVLQLREESEQLRRKLSDARRAEREAQDEMIDMEERLEDAMAFAECLRADNEVSPPELRLAFQCWRAITMDGTHNPAGPGGRGIHGLAVEWLKENGHKLNQDATARFCAVLSWRKRGAGAIRSR